MVNILPEGTNNLHDILGLNNYTYPHTWAFKDGNKRKQGELILSDTSAALQIRVKEDHITDFAKQFSKITSHDDFSRIDLIGGSGLPDFALFNHGRALRTVTYLPYYILYQKNSTGAIDEKLSSIRAEIPNVNAWFGKSMIGFSFADKKFEDNDKTLKFKVGSYIDVSICVTVDFSIGPKFTAQYYSYAELTFSEPTRYPTAIRFFRFIEEFFNFIFPQLSSQFIFTSHKQMTSKNTPVTTDIIVPLYADNSMQKRENVYGLLFSSDEVTNIEEMLTNWVVGYTEFEQAWQALKSLRTNKDATPEARFLSIIGALENMHRKFFEKIDDRVKQDFRQHLKDITMSMAKEDRNLVRGKLRNGYEPILHDRLKELYHLAISFGCPQMGTDVLEKAVNTRNNLVHTINMADDKVLPYRELLDVTTSFTIYLKVLLLHIIGCKQDELKAIVQKSSQLKFHYTDFGY